MVNSNSGWPDWYITGGNSMAHELGHNKGLKHMNCSGDESAGGSTDPNYPWPYPTASCPRWMKRATTGSTSTTVSGAYRRRPCSATIRPPHLQPGVSVVGVSVATLDLANEYCKLLPQYGISCGLWAAAQTAQERLEEAVVADPVAFADPAEVMRCVSHRVRCGQRTDQPHPGTARFNNVYRFADPLPDAVQQQAEKYGYRRAFALAAETPFTLVQINNSGQVFASQESTWSTMTMKGM